MGIQFISVFLLLNIFSGGSVLSLLADPSKTGESISSRYSRSDQIGPKFQKAYQPLKLNYQWKDNGIILKSGKGKMAKEEFIDGKTGKTKKSAPVNSASEGDESMFLPPQSRWGRSPASSDNVSITFENSFDRPVRVYWVDFEG